MKNMNFIKGGIIAIFAMFAVSQSCNDLDLQPLDQLTPDTYYKTVSDFDGAIFAAYSSIQDLWGTSTETLSERGEFWAVTLTATDDAAVNEKFSNGAGGYDNAKNLDKLQFRSSQTCWAAAYTQIYEAILRANIVLSVIDGENNLTADQKKAFVAEAKFIRGMMHFLAMQLWGTPPLVTELKTNINDLASPNSTTDALFAAILKDFQDASADLPASWDAANAGRATKWAAKAYEGKVNVWKKDWPAAITAFEAVKASGTYSLFKGGAPMDNYEDAFDFAKENGSESIFEIQYGGPFSDDNLWVFDDTHSEAFKASQGTGRVWYFDVSGDVSGFGGGLGWFVPSQSLVDEYEAGDPRLTATVYKAGDTYYDRNVGSRPYDATWSSTGYNIRKYGGPRNAVSAAYSPNGQAGFNNERWYRYSEMLLLHAEALIENGRTTDGIDIINNDIRARVGLPATTITDPIKALRHERRVELALEGNRWFDITRWGIGAEVFGAAWKDDYKVFPFPEAEINRSAGKMKQNTGY
jgi:starch-binding outer membrane protein, SusD/RagB family